MDPQLEISGLIRPIYDTYKILSSEWKNLFDIGLLDYLNTQTEKFYYTNTFLHRAEKVVFNKIYHPIKASYKDLTTDFEELEELLKEYKNLTLVGSAGSGKSTLIKHIYLKAIQEKNKIPVLIELRNLNEFEGNFEKLITEKILKTKIKPNDITFIRALQSGKFLFLLDGYDEIFSSKKQSINQQIEIFVDTYSQNSFLITTRPGSGIESFPRFYDFKVEELSNDEVIHFVKKMVDNEEKRDRIITSIEGDNNYSEYLRNPLLLSMFIMAFEIHPEIPKRKSSFYRNVFDTLYSKHDGVTKNSYLREKITKLQMEDFEHILSVYCYLTLLEGLYAFTFEQVFDVLQKIKKTFSLNFNIEDLIHDLRTSISILILDGFEYSFPHRSMQEYFTALFLSKLPTDKKPKAYANLSEALEKSSEDYSFNLWNLCKEMDETVFLKVFLIPHLEKLAKKLDYKEGKLLDKFIELYDLDLYRDKISREEGANDIVLVRTSNFDTSLIQFAIGKVHSEIYSFPDDANCAMPLIELYMKDIEKEQHFLAIKNKPAIKQVLIDYGILDKLEDIKSKVHSQIEHCKLIVNRNKGNLDELLNL